VLLPLAGEGAPGLDPGADEGRDAVRGAVVPFAPACSRKPARILLVELPGRGQVVAGDIGNATLIPVDWNASG